jgi:catechol 2,3-dioxygenase-like lactoylglutathione lyase family enzyme
VTQVHHVGLCPADLEQSLRFYRDGIGLDLLFDVHLDVDLAPLLGIPTTRVRTAFLGDRGAPEAGTLELLGAAEFDAATQPTAAPALHRGLCLLSFQVPVEPALARLAGLGLGGQPRRMTAASGALAATVTDPDGVTVELLDRPMSFPVRILEAGR